MAHRITHTYPLQHRSPRHSPSAASASVPDASDEELTRMIRSVRLDRDMSNKVGESEDWQPSQTIKSDLSAIDFDKQAVSNSLAASRAMAHVPASLKAVLGPSLKQVPRHPLPQRPVQGLRDEGRHKLPDRPAEDDRERATKQRQGKNYPYREDFETTWFSAPADNKLDDPTPGAWAWKDRVPSGWRQPKFQPSSKYEEAAARERLRPPTLGGKSNKDQLGSVNESWGPMGEEGEKVYGMFEIERDPPSRSTSPFKEESPRLKREEVRAAKNEAYEKARQGTPYAGLPYAQQRWTPHTMEIKSSRACGSRPSTFASGHTPSGNDRYDTTQDRNPATSASRDVFGPRRTFGQMRQ